MQKAQQAEQLADVKRCTEVYVGSLHGLEGLEGSKTSRIVGAYSITPLGTSHALRLL